MFKNLKISELEIGPRYITLYGAPHGEILRLGTELYPRLPNELRELNRKSLAHVKGDVPMFHPYGDPKELQREHPAHFHILTPGNPYSSLDTIITKLDKMGVDVGDAEITKVEDKVMPSMTKDCILTAKHKQLKLLDDVVLYT